MQNCLGVNDYQLDLLWSIFFIFTPEVDGDFSLRQPRQLFFSVSFEKLFTTPRKLI